MPSGSPVPLKKHEIQPVGKAGWDQQYRDGRWNYLGRSGEHERYSALAERVYLSEADQVLDLGCGEGLLLRQLDVLGFAGRYVGVDWSYEALARHRPGKGQFFVCANLTQVSFTEQFNVVILSEVLYYLTNPWAVLQAARKLVAPGGELLLTLYRPPADRRPEWHRYIAELEEGLRRHANAEPASELSAAESARTWALYAFQQRVGPGQSS